MIKPKIIKAYALKNAIEHNGKAQTNSIIPGLFNHGLKKENIKKIVLEINKILKQINSLSIDKQKQEFENYKDLIGHRHERQGLPELPNLKKGKVITRMSPSPSGPLHIGHILTILPNFLYAKEFKGKFYIRIEDTNPEGIYKPAYKMIKTDCKWLCKNNVEFVIQSNRMNLYYKYAEKLINKNSAYVCTCNPEKFKDFLLKTKPCPCRNLPVKQQLQRWEKMLDKIGYKQGEAVLRFKSNLKDKNPAMRDFPLARINKTTHPLQKNKYKVWPLMNLAVTVDDIEMKMTHIIRGKDHKDNAKRQKMIYSVLGLKKKYPITAFIGMVHFKDLEFSSRKITQDLLKGKYKSWDDPRLPTIASLRKRGYKPETFEKFVIQRGISETDKVITQKDFFLILDNFNKEKKEK